MAALPSRCSNFTNYSLMFVNYVVSKRTNIQSLSFVGHNSPNWKWLEEGFIYCRGSFQITPDTALFHHLMKNSNYYNVIIFILLHFMVI
jgi:hypothetical protein